MMDFLKLVGALPPEPPWTRVLPGPVGGLAVPPAEVCPTSVNFLLTSLIKYGIKEIDRTATEMKLINHIVVSRLVPPESIYFMIAVMCPIEDASLIEDTLNLQP